ncbi:MAG TPA: hypothetical protein VF921_15680 [Vicinamibacterales bacterium]
MLAVAIVVSVVCLPRAEQGPGQAEGHLKVSGTRFVKPDGTAFEWRGISAFRLLELVAHGREADADVYLGWAASKKLTVARVLGMADNLFKLSPADGQHALPRLLELAQKRGLHVEVVALADTATIRVDYPRHVKAIGEICARYPNALVEIANEPVHPTQATAVHEAGYLKSLATLVPAGVPVSLGSVENGNGFADGTYVTWHAPRSGAWPAEIAHGAAMMERFKKPLVNDEPMGAGEKALPGRRDNDPEHFRQAAAASRRAGLGATFHYEGGLQASLPSKIELACLDAWLAGLTANR